MFDEEGSVEVDTGSIPSVSPQQNTQTQGSQQKGSQQEEAQTQEQQETEKKDQSVMYTEKGTKKDPNPLSAAHQELANTRRLLTQYEQILKDPALLAQYAKTIGLAVSQENQQKQSQMFSGDSFETAEDIAKALNELYGQFEEKTRTYEETIQVLRNQIQAISEGRQVELIAQRIESDIQSLRSKYSALNPKPDEQGNPTNPDYNPELESVIVDLYQRIDFDPTTNMFRGSVSLADVAEYIMKSQQIGQKVGTKTAQTNVIEKKIGKVVTSQKTTTTEPEPSDPESAIAARIASAFRT